MENTLKFNSTVSINRFKAVNNISAINVIKNPHTQKRFFTCPDDSSISGKIAEKINFGEPLFVSECADTDSGESFRLLHNRADNTPNVVQVL